MGILKSFMIKDVRKFKPRFIPLADEKDHLLRHHPHRRLNFRQLRASGQNVAVELLRISAQILEHPLKKVVYLARKQGSDNIKLTHLLL